MVLSGIRLSLIVHVVVPELGRDAWIFVKNGMLVQCVMCLVKLVIVGKIFPNAKHGEHAPTCVRYDR